MHDVHTGVRIEPERPPDAEAIADVVGRAFAGQPTVAELVTAIRTSPYYEPELALVARTAGRTVGFVMISHAVLEESDGTRHDVLTLSPLAVHPAHHRRGIGSALVREVLTRVDDRADLPRLVTLEGDPRFYGRLGFESAPDLGVAIELPSWAPAAAAQVYRLTGYDPAVRGRLRYPAAFDVVAE